MNRIAIFNRKGGTHKSTISTSLGHGLAISGIKTIILDMDSQHDSCNFLGLDVEEIPKFEDYLEGKVKLKDCIISAREDLDVIPVGSVLNVNSALEKEFRLDLVMEDKLKELELDYEAVVIDCSPTESKLNSSILCYAENIIVPVNCEGSSVNGLANIYAYLSHLRLSTDKIKAVIPTNYVQNTKESNINFDIIKDFFSDTETLVTQPIPARVKVKEATRKGYSIFEYDKPTAELFITILNELGDVIE